MSGVLPPIFVELKAKASEFHAEMGKARAEVEHMTKHGEANFKKFAAVGKAALIGMGGVAVAVGGYGLEMADKYETAHAKLEAALKASGKSFDELQGPISGVEKRLESLGFTNTDVEDSLARLTVATKDPSKAMSVMTQAADLARLKNISLSQASDTLAKALTGNLRPLKTLGIDLPQVSSNAEKLVTMQQTLTSAQDAYRAQLETIHAKHTVTESDLIRLRAAKEKVTFAQQQLNNAQNASKNILDALDQRLHGQADSYTESFAGKMAVLRARVEDLGKNIGMHLIPTLVKLVDWVENHAIPDLEHFGQWVKRNEGWLVPLAAAIGSVVAVGYTVVKVVKLWTAAQAMLNLVMEANPLVLIATLIAAVAAAVFIAYKKSETFRDGVKTAFRLVEEAAGHLVGIVVTGFKFLLDIWLSVAGGILHGAAAAFGWVPGIGGKLKGAAKAFDTFKSDVDSKLSAIASNAESWGQQTADNYKKGFNAASPHLHVSSQVVNGVRVASKVTMFAEGGIVTRPTLAMIGEAGYPEAVIPLKHGLRAAAGGELGGLYVTVNVNAPLTSSSAEARRLGQVVAEGVRDELLKMKKRKGALGLA